MFSDTYVTAYLSLKTRDKYVTSANPAVSRVPYMSSKLVTYMSLFRFVTYMSLISTSPERRCLSSLLSPLSPCSSLSSLLSVLTPRAHARAHVHKQARTHRTCTCQSKERGKWPCKLKCGATERGGDTRPRCKGRL